jgi:hypothetical protein
LGSTNGVNAAERGSLRLDVTCGMSPSLAAAGPVRNPAAETPRSVMALATYIIGDRAPQRDVPRAWGCRQ